MPLLDHPVSVTLHHVKQGGAILDKPLASAQPELQVLDVDTAKHCQRVLEDLNKLYSSTILSNELMKRVLAALFLGSCVLVKAVEQSDSGTANCLSRHTNLNASSAAESSKTGLLDEAEGSSIVVDLSMASLPSPGEWAWNSNPVASIADIHRLFFCTFRQASFSLTPKVGWWSDVDAATIQSVAGEILRLYVDQYPILEPLKRPHRCLRSVASERGLTVETPERLKAECAETVDTSVFRRSAKRFATRQLWEYVDETEVGRAFLSVLDTLKKLYEKEACYRDINPGNILLGERQEAAETGQEAFILDFEYTGVKDKIRAQCKCTGPADCSPKGNHSKSKKSLASCRSVANDRREIDLNMNALSKGAIQFLALSHLDTVSNCIPLASGARITVSQESCHDWQFVTWSFGYVLLRKLLPIAALTGDCEIIGVLNKLFRRVFGQTEISEIYEQRKLLAPLKWVIDERLGSFLKEHLDPTHQSVLAAICLHMDQNWLIRESFKDRILHDLMTKLVHIFDDFLLSLFKTIA